MSYKFITEKQDYKGKVLDEHLANGYYRMQELMFTTSFIHSDTNEDISPVFWLRTPVTKITESKTAKLIRKTCKPFSVTFKKAFITDEISDLYELYKNSISHSISPTCFDYLYQNDYENSFDSLMVEIRNGSQLIAIGYYDKGFNSIAGILNFYHPNYKKYSLGKYLILCKIDYAIENKMEWYYTGYITINTTKFDYKIFPDKNAIEILLPVEKLWKLYKHFTKERLEIYFIENIIGL